MKEMEISTDHAQSCPQLVFGFHGFMDYYSLGIQDDHLVLSKKEKQNHIVLSECKIKNKKPSRFSLKATFFDDIILLYLNKERYVLPFDGTVKGAVGISMKGAGSAEILDFKFRGGI